MHALPFAPRSHVRRRRSQRGALVAAAVLAWALAAAPAAVGAVPGGTPAGGLATATERCPPDAVTVVIDFSDLGGEIESGCADAGGSGTDALLAAGFTEVRDTGGFICAIDALPDPCPIEFTGEFWSYWHGTTDGQWQTYAVGSDDSAPEPGGFEGWRYGDGSAGPAVLPVIAAGTTGADETNEVTEVGSEDSSGPSLALIGGIVVIAVLLTAALLLARRRSGLSRGDGPPGQD